MEFQSSPEIGKLTAALSKAQGQMKGAAKDSKNPFLNSKYADLTSVWEACRQPLTDNELAVIQIPVRGGLQTILSHSSGEWISGLLEMNPIRNDPQGIGSAITYARRYALAAFVGISPEDDDGHAATSQPKNENKNGNGNSASTAPPISPLMDNQKAVTNDQLAQIKKLKDEVGIDADGWVQLLRADYMVETAKSMNTEQAQKLIEQLTALQQDIPF